MVAPRVWKGKHVTTTYTEDHKSFGAFIKSEQAMKPVRQVSWAMKAAMMAKAPYDEKRDVNEDGPHYRDSFDVERGKGLVTVSKRYPNPRPFMQITNDSRHAAALEFGTADSEPQSIMRKTGSNFGTLSKRGRR